MIYPQSCKVKGGVTRGICVVADFSRMPVTQFVKSSFLPGNEAVSFAEVGVNRLFSARYGKNGHLKLIALASHCSVHQRLLLCSLDKATEFVPLFRFYPAQSHCKHCHEG